MNDKVLNLHGDKGGCGKSLIDESYFDNYFNNVKDFEKKINSNSKEDITDGFVDIVEED
jgi:hypothetical protein